MQTYHDHIFEATNVSSEQTLQRRFVYSITVCTCSYVQYFHILGQSVITTSGEYSAHAMLILSCVDLPAQALLLNMKQFNGAFACNVCEQEGEVRPTSHLHRNWPYQPHVALRTHESFLSAAKKILTHTPVSFYTLFLCMYQGVIQ